MYPDAYIQYLVYFHGVRDYFECHEILEEEWKNDPRDRRKRHWRGLIQISVALYHWRRGNFTGAERSLKNALNNLKNEKEALTDLALDYGRMIEQLRRLQQKVKKQKHYESINLPITDGELIRHCEMLCKEKGCTMGNPSDLTDIQLINKHQLPNREQIISKREAKKRGGY
jgi:hypothetical protein